MPEALDCDGVAADHTQIQTFRWYVCGGNLIGAPRSMKIGTIAWPVACLRPRRHGTKMATSARVVTAETPAMLAQRPRACADRAIGSARSPGGGAAARRRPIAVGLRWPSPTSPGSSTNTGAEHRVASPPRPPSWSRWYAPPDVVLP